MGIFSLLYKAVVKPSHEENAHTEFMRLRLEIDDLESAGEGQTRVAAIKRFRQRELLPLLAANEREYHLDYIHQLPIQQWELDLPFHE